MVSIWYPKGGFHKVVDALLNIAIDKGATLLTSTSVTQINIDPATNQATGITLSNSETIPCDVVISNADLVYTYKTLLPSAPGTIQRHDKLIHTSSTISFYWGMRCKVSNKLQAHNVFLASNYRDSFLQIFNDNRMPSEPSFYVHVASRIDESAAPVGKDVVTVLVPVGHLPSDTVTQAIETMIDEWVVKARDAVIATLDKQLGFSSTDTSFGDLIEYEKVNTPLTWKDEFNLTKGSALGLSHGIFQSLYFRPSSCHASHKNVFFVGASTHPGTGVSTVMASAKLVANQVSKYLESTSSEETQKLKNKILSMDILLKFGFVIVLVLAMSLMWERPNLKSQTI
eukprot:jgi/Hompol1/1809/HPOL_001616-RA